MNRQVCMSSGFVALGFDFSRGYATNTHSSHSKFRYSDDNAKPNHRV